MANLTSLPDDVLLRIMSFIYEWTSPAARTYYLLNDERMIDVDDVVDLKLISKRFSKLFDDGEVLSQLTESLRQEWGVKEDQMLLFSINHGYSEMV